MPNTTPDKLAPFKFHGVTFAPGSNGQAKAECPLCGKQGGHFIVNSKTGQWDCKSCGQSGNGYTFLDALHRTALKSTTSANYRSLEKERGIPARFFKEAGLAWDGNRWLFPMRNLKAGFANVLSRNGDGKWYSTPACQMHLIGGEQLALAKPDTPVFVCEGVFDSAAMRSLLSSQRKPGIVVAVPGASTFKPAWVEALRGRDVVLLYDNDEPGRAGMTKAAKLLAPVAKSIREIVWPVKPPKGWKLSGKEWGKGTDVNDLAAGMKPAAAWKALNAMLQPVVNTITIGNEPAKESEVKLTCLADVKPQKVSWLWADRVPLGKLTLLVGDPGVGKSLASLDMAARVSTGTAWPDIKRPTKRGTVILLSAEDDTADTVVPRLLAAGADVSKISVLNILSLREDLGRLETAIKGLPDCRLVVIDPVSAYLAGVDSHRNADVRGLLAPLAALASKHGVAIVGVTHLNKMAEHKGSAMYRATGSLAFIAAARAAWLVTPDLKGDKGRKLMLPLKANLAAAPSGLAFKVASDGANSPPRIAWEQGAVRIDPDEALCHEETDDHMVRDEVADWLTDVLGEGKVSVKELKTLASNNGYSWRTLNRVKGSSGVKSVRDGFGKGSTCFWELP